MRLKSNNINRKIVTVIGEFSPSGIALMLALVDNFNVFVPVDKSSKNLDDIITISETNTLIDLNTNNISCFTEKEIINPLLIKLMVQKDSSGLILFSSGSSGKPKATLHNFNPLIYKYVDTQNLKAIRSIAFLLFDHIGGINTVLYNLFSNSMVIIPSSREPNYILGLIEKYKVELLPTTPSFLNLILLNKTYESFNLSSLKTISYGTEPMPESTLVSLNKLFPHIYFKQTYGLSEVGILRTKSENSSSLWLKIGDDDHQVDIRDGILWIKSKMSMLGYLNAPSPFDKDGWFNTQDRVEVKDGFIKILGRDSELINVGGLKVYPTEVENVILGIEGIIDVLAYGIDNPIMGKVVAIKIYTNETNLASLKTQIINKCAQNLEKFKRPVKIEFTNENFQSNRLKKKRL